MYDGEVCMDCGFPASHGIGMTFWNAPNDLWNFVMGGPEAADDPGGVVCCADFWRRCRDLGIHISWRAEVYAGSYPAIQPDVSERASSEGAHPLETGPSDPVASRSETSDPASPPVRDSTPDPTSRVSGGGPEVTRGLSGGEDSSPASEPKEGA